MPVYPGAPSGSHRSPSHTRTTTRPAQPTTASWRAIKSRSEAVSTRNAHPRARDPAALRCKPFIVRSRRGAPTVQLLSLLRTSPPMPNHSDPDIPKQSDAQQGGVSSEAGSQGVHTEGRRAVAAARGRLERFLEHRIADKRVLRLIQKWLRAGVIEDGEWSKTEEGTAQGASISPLLANVSRSALLGRHFSPHPSAS
jgi:hypothetical protein